MECLECQCTNLIDVEDDVVENNTYMCEDCGAEQTDNDWKYRKYKVGKVESVEELKAPLKKCQVTISDEGGDEPLQIVTNAKHIAQNDIVVVATMGAIVPAGAEPEEDGGQGIVVKAAVVGGVKSNGMLCDGVMLQWAGGAKGVLVKLDGSTFSVGSTPPAKKPITK